MFSFFKRKPKGEAAPAAADDTAAIPDSATETAAVPAPEEDIAIHSEAPTESPMDMPDLGTTDASDPAQADQSDSPVAKDAKRSWFSRFMGGGSAPEPDASDTSEVPAPGTVSLVDELAASADEPVDEAETSEADGEIIEAAPLSAEEKRSWMERLRSGLSKTSSNLTTLFIGARIDDELYEELESALLMADAGVEATQAILDALKKRVRSERLTEAQQVRAALKELLIELLEPLQKSMVLDLHKPTVMMIAGVNGAGKTTTIGKLAKHLQHHGQSVLLAAGDTFRAAAREQLAIWGERNNVTVIAQESGDPAAVAFDAVHSARARGTKVVMVDTAGRLPTQLHLMDELKKIKRVIGKAMASAPHEVLLVIDGNTGQNALAQVRSFDEALGLTGLIVTKLDGTAKGGVLAAIAKVRPIPVYFIGVGEKIEDLQPFDALEFVNALLD